MSVKTVLRQPNLKYPPENRG